MTGWKKKLDLTKVGGSEGNEEMVSIDKYFDKFAYREEEEYRWQWRRMRATGRCFFFGGGLNWRSLKGSKANGKREGLDIYSKEIE